ncbi:MAG: hypothetical protein ACYC8T_11630 [Myxococcaceae bacterium]
MRAWRWQARCAAVLMVAAALTSPAALARSKRLKAENCEPRCSEDKEACHTMCKKAGVKPALCFPVCDKEAQSCVKRCREPKKR